MLSVFALCAMVLVVVSMFTDGGLAVWSILFVGLFDSIQFPTIFTLGVAEMGPLTGEASGLLITAIVGGAIIPELQGVLADRVGVHHAFILPILCFLYIAWYGVRGSKVKGAGWPRKGFVSLCTLHPVPCSVMSSPLLLAGQPLTLEEIAEVALERPRGCARSRGAAAHPGVARRGRWPAPAR